MRYQSPGAEKRGTADLFGLSWMIWTAVAERSGDTAFTNADPRGTNHFLANITRVVAASLIVQNPQLFFR